MERFFNRHAEYEELLNEHLDGRLDSEREGKFQTHVKECGRCQAELRDLEAVTAILRAQPMEEAPRSFALPLTTAHPSRAAESTVANGAAPGFLRRAGNGSLALLRAFQVATAAAALVLVALVGLDMSGVMAPEPSPAITQLHAPEMAADPDGEARMMDMPAADAGQESDMEAMTLPPQPSEPTDPVITGVPPAPEPAPAPPAALEPQRTILDWLRLSLSALTAALALGVVGITWQIYRHPM